MSGWRGARLLFFKISSPPPGDLLGVQNAGFELLPKGHSARAL